MPILLVPANTWTYGTGTYSLSAISTTIPDGAKIGGFSVRTNSDPVTYLNKAGYGDQPEYSLLTVSVLSSSGSLLGYVAITQIVTASNPAYSLNNVNLTIDGNQVSSGDFTNSLMPVVINGGSATGTGGSGGSTGGTTTCNCTSEIAAAKADLQAQFDSLSATVNSFVSPDLSAYALRSDLDREIEEMDAGLSEIFAGLDQAFKRMSNGV